MTGFKSGASDDDPLAGGDEDDKDDLNRGGEASQSLQEPSTGSADPAAGGLPWLYARDSITDGRAKTVQLHLQQSTLDREQDALRDVPIDETVQKADLREAAYLVGLAQLDNVADQLREWGYDAE